MSVLIKRSAFVINDNRVSKRLLQRTAPKDKKVSFKSNSLDIILR